MSIESMREASVYLDKSLEPSRLLKYRTDAEDRLSGISSVNEAYPFLLEEFKEKQQNLGQYHTPDQIVEIVLDSLPSNFCEEIISGKRLVDPSCGTGNFLVAVTKEIIASLEAKGFSGKELYESVNEILADNLYGFEIDSAIALAALKNFQLTFKGLVNAPQIIVLDALGISDPKPLHGFLASFDYVVGNPPWVEVKRLPDFPKTAIQSKFQVSNLYGAFILQGRNLLKEGGHLAYVVPRSFTGGRYYSKLRSFLKNKCTLEKISYYSKRNQSFHGGDVLQELVVIGIKNSNPKPDSTVKCIPCSDISDYFKEESFTVSTKELFSRHDLIMLLADSKEQFDWIRKIGSLKNFDEMGFAFSTGQIVLHRSRDFLKSEFESGCHRVIYVHDIINKDGQYAFRDNIERLKDRSPYAVTVGRMNFDGRQKHLGARDQISCIKNYLHHDEMIVCRRRSHKGDKRRFVGVLLNHLNILQAGLFLENGLNYIKVKQAKKYTPSLAVLFRILRSDLFEMYFSIVSSNTQLNKNDMFLFGIPEVNDRTGTLYSKLESIDSNNLDAINLLVAELYSIA
jgi:adenine-specific DNA-methyltransferase